MLLYILVAVLVGSVVTMQPGINSMLGKRLGAPIQAAVVNFGVGFLALSCICLAMTRRMPSPARLVEGPWWIGFGGGLLGASFVTSSLLLAPRIGATLLFAALVTGQMIGGLVLDQYGFLGYPKNPITTQKVLGILLVIGGVVLLARR